MIKPISPIAARVYEKTVAIPPGKVATYGQIAQQVGLDSPQAIGQILRRNPFAPFIPCHRVVSSSMKLHGFQGKTDQTTLNQKAQLLQQEGVAFSENGTIQPSALFNFES